MSKKAATVHTVIAVVAPVLNVLILYVIYVRVLGTAPSRTAALLMLVLFVGGGYCGLVVSHCKEVSIAVRIVGLAGAVLSICLAVPLLIYGVIEGL